MYIEQSDIPFLSGESYSNGRQIKYQLEPDDRSYRSRADVLVEICRGKRVIHVGCVDHDVASIKHKIQRGKWLHQILCGVADRCFGVDIQEAGIHYLRDELGYEDVAVVNVAEDLCEPLLEGEWDILLIPEVLEHIDDPVAFLKGVRAQFRGRVDSLVMTVPNAFSHDNWKSARHGVESINTDHRYWFTPYTLAKVAMAAGFEVQAFSLCRHGVVKRRSFFKNAFFRRHPLLRSDIVMRLGMGV